MCRPNTNESWAEVQLRAIIQDLTAVLPEEDAEAGDIRHATVTFVDRENGNAPVSAPLPVELLDPSDPTTGVVRALWTPDIGNSDSEQFRIGIVVSGYYTRDDQFDDTVITVSKPLPYFITGGGYLVNEQSAGQYAGDLGLRTNFGLNLKYNKKVTNLQGKANIIIRHDGRVLQIKTNATQSLVVNADSGEATFVSKANLTDITDPLNPISLGGNLSLEMQVTDRGEPGLNDSIGVSLWDRNALLFSSNWDGTRTAEQTLAGGNLKVHGDQVPQALSAATGESDLVFAALAAATDNWDSSETARAAGSTSYDWSGGFADLLNITSAVDAKRGPAPLEPVISGIESASGETLPGLADRSRWDEAVSQWRQEELDAELLEVLATDMKKGRFDWRSFRR